MKKETKQQIKEAFQLILISLLCTAFVLSLHGNNKKEIKTQKTEYTNKIINDSIKQHVR